MDFKKLSPEQMKIAEMVIEAAEANKVDPNLLLAQAFRESQFKQIPSADPKSDAFGVMQIRPSTAELNKLGDITDLQTNIFGGAKLMRQYLDKYKSPEAALLAYHQGPGVADLYIKNNNDLSVVGPKGLDYVIAIGENGGFGQSTKADASTEGNPNNPFAVGVPLADKAREAAITEETTTVSPESSGDEIDPAKAALAGAAANLFLPMFTDPKVSPKVDTGRAQEANLSAQDKLELARRNFQEVAPQGMYNLEETYRQNQMELERLKNEQRSAQERLRGLPKSAPTIESSTLPVSDEVPSRTKAGASGASNWVRAMGEDVPDVLADQAANMRKDNPRGGQAIIDANTAAIQKQFDLGLGDYSLTRTEGGAQLALPPTTVAERQAEIERQSQANQAELERKAYETKIQQETQSWIAEQQRLAHEEQLERLRQERAAAGERQNILSSQKKAVAPLQRALTKAEMEAEIAQRKLARANQQPNAAGRVLERVGVGSTNMGAIPRTITGGGLAYFGVMSYQDALKRFKEGDTSEGVLKALQAGSAAAAMLPPVGKGLTKARGAGALTAVPLYGYELGRRLLKERPDEK
jgi:soluble lytic murein transglycosylase-like protein